MPFLVLGLLIVIAVILYLRFANTVGDPSLKPRPFMDLFHQAPTPEEQAAAEAAEAAAAAEKSANAETASAAAAGEAPGGAEADADDASFKSMEELTEFYRREAERLTGIKH